jgi:hypothetical protein
MSSSQLCDNLVWGDVEIAVPERSTILAGGEMFSKGVVGLVKMNN